MSSMKRWITPSSFSNRTLTRQGVLLGLGFWLLAQIPVGAYFYRHFLKSDRESQAATRAATQALLGELFQQSARFGDLVYARGAIIQLGAPLGLADVGICRGKKEILPRPIESRCLRSDLARLPVRQGDERLELEFLWRAEEISSRRILLRAMAASALISFLLVIGVVALISRSLSKRVQRLAGLLASGNTLESLQGASMELHELQPIVVAFHETKQHLELSLHENVRLKAEAATGALAAQVSHDIRSPLAALEMASADISHLPEDKRVLVRAAVNRIRDIANSLLDRQQAQAAAAMDSAAAHAASPQLLSSLIDPVISEKRLQFRSHARIEIEFQLDAASYGIFATVQPIEFKRVLSNLVNNAVEAFGEGPGAVDVSLGARDGRALVSVRDNGRGIPPEVLAKLGRRGETHGKAGGSGLGLHHARTSAESWGGSLELSSEVGKGTTATLVLPIAAAPEWFVPELTLTPGRTVVVLDDDASIHQVWQGRLDALKAQERGVKVVHVSTPEELRGWAKKNEAAAQRALCLFDYELLGHKETGLALAVELGLGERVVLVTSRYEEPEVLEGCRRLKARLIPKGLAGMVPLRMEDPPPPPGPDARRLDAVLIDDDPLTRMIWENAASDAGKTLRTFSSPAAFLDESGGIDRRTPIYMDVKLSDGRNGAEESLRVHDLGFAEIYLATGHPPEMFAGLKHLRAVVGKEPPWGPPEGA